MQHTLRSLPGLPLYVLPLSPLSLYSVTLSLLHMLKNTTLSPHLTPSYQGYDMIGPHPDRASGLAPCKTEGAGAKRRGARGPYVLTF